MLHRTPTDEVDQRPHEDAGRFCVAHRQQVQVALRRLGADNNRRAYFEEVRREPHSEAYTHLRSPRVPDVQAARVNR